MNFEIIATPRFRKSLKALAKRHRSLKDDFAMFASSLRENPWQGDEIAPGIRKIRMAISSKGRGKSGGARVITYNIISTPAQGGRVYLIEIYDKSDYSSVDPSTVQGIVESEVAE